MVGIDRQQHDAAEAGIDFAQQVGHGEVQDQRRPDTPIEQEADAQQGRPQEDQADQREHAEVLTKILTEECTGDQAQGKDDAEQRDRITVVAQPIVRLAQEGDVLQTVDAGCQAVSEEGEDQAQADERAGADCLPQDLPTGVERLRPGSTGFRLGGPQQLAVLGNDQGGGEEGDGVDHSEQRKVMLQEHDRPSPDALEDQGNRGLRSTLEAHRTIQLSICDEVTEDWQLQAVGVLAKNIGYHVDG